MEAKLQVEVISSATGYTLYINGWRVAGPKPLGGGQTVHQWYVAANELKRFVPIPDQSST